LIVTKIGNKSSELLRYREMFTGLVNREVRARYRGSALGFVWSLLNPLLMMAVYSLVFSVYMRINIPNYSLFLFCGLLPWQWFTTAITNATGTVVANGNLIKKVYFPLEILPLVNVTTNLVNFLLSMPVLFGFMLLDHAPFTPNLCFLPLLIAIQFLLTLGISLALCTLNAFFRDVEQLMGPLLMMWFYVTPVIYRASAIPARFKVLFFANPMAPLIASYQSILFDGQRPPLHLLAVSGATGVVLFVVGYAVFYRQKFKFAEVV
jgi:ABC-type polysaccharide/polyol phosphate export permease